MICKKELLICIFLFLNTCSLEKIKANEFESKINETLILTHNYPQQINSSVAITQDALLNTLSSYHTLSKEQINRFSDYIFTLKNISLFPEIKFFAVYQESSKSLLIYDTGLTFCIEKVLLDKNLVMENFFLDLYSDQQTRPDQAQIRLLIFYKTKDVGVKYLKEIKLLQHTETWRLIKTSQVTAVKNGKIQYTAYNKITTEDIRNISCHPNKEDLDNTEKYETNNQHRPKYHLILGGPAIAAILLFVYWYKYL